MNLRTHLQFPTAPAETFQLARDDPVGFFLGGLCNLLTVVLTRRLRLHLFQQFLPEFFIAQIPAPTDALPFLRLILVASSLHYFLKPSATGRTVLWNPHFPQESIHP